MIVDFLLMAFLTSMNISLVIDDLNRLKIKSLIYFGKRSENQPSLCLEIVGFEYLFLQNFSEVQDISKVSWGCFSIPVVEKPTQKVDDCV